MSKRFLIGIVSAIIIFAFLICSTILISINNAYNYNAYQDDETGTTVYIGNLLNEDGTGINLSTYNELISRIGDLGTISGGVKASQMNNSTPIIFQMGTVYNYISQDYEPVYWQVVYRTNDYITVWTTQPYTIANHDSGSGFSSYDDSYLRVSTQNVYQLLSSRFPILNLVSNTERAGIIVTPQQMETATGNTWQSNQADTKVSGTLNATENSLTQNSINDAFWIPSYYEVHYSGETEYGDNPGNADARLGFWGLSQAEKGFRAGYSTDGNNLGNPLCWLRSGNSDGSNRKVCIATSGNVDYEYSFDNYRGVRPATHISLTELFKYSQTYIITTQANDSNLGSVSVGGEYFYGTTIELTATPSENATFEYWEVDGAILENSTETISVYVTQNATYTAHFELIPYIVNISTDASLGKILFNNELVDNNQSILPHGTQLILYAVPNQKVAFLYWQIVGESGTTTSRNNPLELSITEDVTITAVFTDSIIDGVAVSAVGGGEVRIGGYDGNIDENTQVVLNAICYSGYTFDGWYTMKNGVLTKIDALGNYTAVTINVADYDGKQIIAKFELIDNSHINDDTNN